MRIYSATNICYYIQPLPARLADMLSIEFKGYTVARSSNTQLHIACVYLRP